MTDLSQPDERAIVPTVSAAGTAPDLAAIRARVVAAVGLHSDCYLKDKFPDCLLMRYATDVPVLLAEIDRLEAERAAALGDAQWDAAIEAAANVARDYKKPVRPKPTIEELEAILVQDSDPGIEITPDGEVRVVGTHLGHDISAAIRALLKVPVKTTAPVNETQADLGLARALSFSLKGPGR